MFGLSKKKVVPPPVAIRASITRPRPDSAVRGGDIGSRPSTAKHVTPANTALANIDLHNQSSPKTIVVRSIEQFASLSLPFEEVIQGISIGPHLKYRICPVLFGGKEHTAAARACVLVTPDYVGTAELEMVKNSLTQAKSGAWERWALYDHIVVHDQVLLPVVRGAITRDLLTNHRRIALSPVDNGLKTTFRKIVDWAVREQASDIHFVADLKSQASQVYFTINGRYIKPAEWAIPTSTLFEMLRVAYSTSSAGNGTSYDPVIEQQCRIEIPYGHSSVMLRWASMATNYPGPSVTARVLHLEAEGQIKALDDLHYLPSQVQVFRRAMNSEKGAIIIVGVVGSGKTHTLASICSAIPAYRKKMGIEDPVELIIPGMLQKSVSRSLEGGDDNPFGPALNTMKRSAMNDMLIGEVRDLHTGQAFMDIVSSGTSAYTTTHAPSAVGAFDKLAGDTVKISRDFLAAPGHIKLVTYQALIPKNCPDCALGINEFMRDSANAKAIDTQYFQRIEALYQIDIKTIRMRNPNGCTRCRHPSLSELHGFVGRDMVAEQLEPDDNILEMIRRADSVGMHRYFASLRTEGYDHPDMQGKTAMDCAVYKMVCGALDPREIEPRFHAFETEAIRRNLKLRQPFYTQSSELASASAKSVIQSLGSPTYA